MVWDGNVTVGKRFWIPAFAGMGGGVGVRRLFTPCLRREERNYPVEDALADLVFGHYGQFFA